MPQEPHNLAETPDEQLAASAQAASSEAFEMLVRRYQAPLLRYLLRRTGSRADAEDVLQETFVRAYRYLGQFRSGARWRPWLYAIARNAAGNHHRRPRLVVAPPLDPDHFPDPHASRVEDADSARRLWDLARALLSEDQFDALWLHYVEDLPTGQVARVMDRSWVSVKTLLVRARRRLAPHAAKLYGISTAAKPAAGVS